MRDDNRRNLTGYGIIPVNYSTLAESLAEYKSPKDKISQLEREGHIIRLKKGSYVVSPEITQQSVSLELIANHLYGPSYVSLESALSYYGIIPERVVIMRSATLKRSKEFSNALGTFEYVTVPDTYYSIGIRSITIMNSFTYLIASPEKALCDLILTTSGLRLQSMKAIREYLLEDIRLDPDAIDSWNTEIISQCIENGYKKNELNLLLNFIADECNF